MENMPTKCCRICFNKGYNYINLNTKLNYREKLLSCVPEIDLDLLRTSYMCFACVSMLENAHCFRLKCLDSNRKISDNLLIERVNRQLKNLDYKFLVNDINSCAAIRPLKGVNETLYVDDVPDVIIQDSILHNTLKQSETIIKRMFDFKNGHSKRKLQSDHQTEDKSKKLKSSISEPDNWDELISSITVHKAQPEKTLLEHSYFAKEPESIQATAGSSTIQQHPVADELTLEEATVMESGQSTQLQFTNMPIRVTILDTEKFMKQVPPDKIVEMCRTENSEPVNKNEKFLKAKAKIIKCSACPKYFTSKKLAVAHFATHTKAEKALATNNNSLMYYRVNATDPLQQVTRAHYKCHVCGKTYIHIKCLLNHFEKNAPTHNYILLRMELTGPES